MMNRNLIISFCLLLQIALFAQKSQVFELDLQKTTDFQRIVVSKQEDETTWTIPFVAFEYPNTPFTAASVRIEGQNLQDLHDRIQIILSNNDPNGIQETYDLHQNHDAEANSNQTFISSLLFFDAIKPDSAIPNFTTLPTKHWLLRIKTLDKNIIFKNNIHKIQLRLFHPKGDVAKNEEASTRPFEVLPPCDLPTAVSRSVWGASWNLTNGKIYADTPRFAPVTHLIVHHSATNNTSTDWNAVVAAIFDGHVNGNGWSDVGYNYLIAPNGTLYVGRGGGNNVIGAHYCAKNTGTMGVCLIGNYMTVAPSDTAMKTLEKLLAWKCIESNINPTGISNHSSGRVDNISGHRAGCATSCPGDSTFVKLAALRQKVQERMALCQTKTADFETQIGTLRLSPNPSWDKKLHINLDLKQIISFEIVISDIQGRRVWMEKVQPTQLNFTKTLNLNYLENGLYICTVQAGAFYVSEKVILGF